MRKFFTEFAAGIFSDMRIEIDFLLAEGDKVDCHFVFYARHTGECGGVAARGNSIRVPAISTFRIADGKLAKPEAGIIFDIAKDFGIQEKAAYSIVVGGMSSVGLNIDWKMNTLVREIKAQLQKKYTA